jgi:hypothetical protein
VTLSGYGTVLIDGIATPIDRVWLGAATLKISFTPTSRVFNQLRGVVTYTVLGQDASMIGEGKMNLRATLIGPQELEFTFYNGDRPCQFHSMDRPISIG